jgi:hypothetical protein
MRSTAKYLLARCDSTFIGNSRLPLHSLMFTKPCTVVAAQANRVSNTCTVSTRVTLFTVPKLAMLQAVCSACSPYRSVTANTKHSALQSQCTTTVNGTVDTIFIEHLQCTPPCLRPLCYGEIQALADHQEQDQELA